MNVIGHKVIGEVSWFLSRNSSILRSGLGHAQIKGDLVNIMSGKFTSDKTVLKLGTSHTLTYF
jgi:hypothetical protein